MKEFEEITIGMKGEDYDGNKGVVCAIGPASIISSADSLGALKSSLDEGLVSPTEPAVLVEMSWGTTAYLYDSSCGFCVR